MNNKLALFVSSPDSYCDVIEVFLKCFFKFWPDCPYEFILSTNTKKYHGITVINNNHHNDTWMDRAIPVLQNIRYKYVLLLCDDCLISKKVNTDSIERIVMDMDKYGIDFCGLANHIKGKKLHTDSLLNFVRKNKPYSLNLQVGIYRREYLLNLLGDGSRSPWELETKWLKEADKADNSYYDNIASCCYDVLGCKNGILKGQWYESVIREMGKKGIAINTKRGVISLKEDRKLHIYSRIGKILPSKVRPLVKKIVSMTGHKFASGN
jgi:hypothetical protein